MKRLQLLAEQEAKFIADMKYVLIYGMKLSYFHVDYHRAEIAKEEQERLEREEEMNYSNMNKWAAMRMRVFRCSENDVKKQQSQVQTVNKWF